MLIGKTVFGGEGIYANTLYFPLNFSINLKVPQVKQPINLKRKVNLGSFKILR